MLDNEDDIFGDYVAQDDSDETLPRGLRYRGPRVPSQILTALLPDLERATYIALQGGEDPIAAETAEFLARGMLALALEQPLPYNREIGSQLDESWYEDAETGTLLMNEWIGRLFDHLDNFTLTFKTYSWLSSDPAEAEYQQFGVIIDWPDIDKMLEARKIARIAMDAEIDHQWCLNLKEKGYQYAIQEADGRVLMHRLTAYNGAELIWEV